MTAIAFIGLGNMGGPMARNLAAAGHRVTGCDPAPAARAAAEANGIVCVATLAEACSGAAAVLTMLPAGEEVRAVYLGADGVLAAAPAGALLIDCSTIDVAGARQVGAAAEAAGFDMLDAPVSGGVAGAEAASLTFMVGGSAAAFDQAKPLLEAMGRNVVHAGGPGNGQAAKTCNNLILGASMIAVAEAFTLGEALGLAPETLFEISSKASGACWAMLNHHPLPGLVETSAANRGYRPGFAAAMMLKDLKLAQEAAAQSGVATPLGAQAAALYTLFVNSGKGDLDYAAIVQLIQGRSER